MSQKDLLSCGFYLHSAKKDPVLTLTTCLPAQAKILSSLLAYTRRKLESVKHCTEWHICKLRIPKIRPFQKRKKKKSPVLIVCFEIFCK